MAVGGDPTMCGGVPAQPDAAPSQHYERLNGYAFQTLHMELWDLQQELSRVRDAIFQAKLELDRKHERETALVEAIVMTERGLRRLEADDAD